MEIFKKSKKNPINNINENAKKKFTKNSNFERVVFKRCVANGKWQT